MLRLGQSALEEACQIRDDSRLGFAFANLVLSERDNYAEPGVQQPSYTMGIFAVLEFPHRESYGNRC
jgi:hypothetical protein